MKILECGIKWSFSRHNGIKLKILSPFENIRTCNEKLKTALLQVYHKAKDELGPTQFDLDNYINEALESLSELTLLQIFIKLLRNIPKEEQKNLLQKLWHRIKENIVYEIE